MYNWLRPCVDIVVLNSGCMYEKLFNGCDEESETCLTNNVSVNVPLNILTHVRLMKTYGRMFFVYEIPTCTQSLCMNCLPWVVLNNIFVASDFQFLLIPMRNDTGWGGEGAGLLKEFSLFKAKNKVHLMYFFSLNFFIICKNWCSGLFSSYQGQISFEGRSLVKKRNKCQMGMSVDIWADRGFPQSPRGGEGRGELNVVLYNWFRPLLDTSVLNSDY